MIRREPHLFGYQASRWTLTMLREVCDWLTLTSEAGMSPLLNRLAITDQRGRLYVHSPDPLE